jgi:hypothetical protein
MQNATNRTNFNRQVITKPAADMLAFCGSNDESGSIGGPISKLGV